MKTLYQRSAVLLLLLLHCINVALPIPRATAWSSGELAEIKPRSDTVHTAPYDTVPGTYVTGLPPTNGVAFASHENPSLKKR
jgi:hypothetical protein